jgi:PAS domain S-box-containing protein
MKAALPDNEPQRLASLLHLHILDTPAEDDFDALTQLATMICDAPISVISLVDKNRQWFKSRRGIAVQETPRDMAFCAHAILQPDKMLYVPDATLDPRFFDNQLVLQANGIRFYAGMPLIMEPGLPLGTLCVIDTKARHLNDFQLTALRLLALQASKLLEVRKLALDHKQKSTELHQSEQRYRSMLDNLPGTIYRCQNDTDRNMLFISDDVLALTGYRAEDFLNRQHLSFNDLILPEDLELVRKQVNSSVQQKLRFEVEYRIKDRCGEIKWLQELGRGVFAATGQLLYLDGFIWDITDRKTVERLKNQFVSTVSHELRTPLTSIAGSLGLLLGGVTGELPEQARQMLNIANDNTQRLTALINDLLDIEKLLAGKMQLALTNINAATLLQRSLVQNQPYASRHASSLQLEPSTDVWLWADEKRLEQIIANLLSNAVKFSPANSVLRLHVSQHSDYAEISVYDQGPGVPANFKDKIFLTFSQAEAADSRSKGGTGLGLAISKELAEAMQGSIDYENLPGGCRFYVRLPLGIKPAI